MNLTERAEVRRKTFYKLTNSADVPEVPSGNRNLILYSADPWQAPSGYYSGYNAAKTSETYNGAVVYKTGTAAWSRLGINLGKHLVERRVVKIGDKLIYSVFAKTDQDTPIKITLYVRYKGSSAAEELNGKPHEFTLTKDWRKISIPFTVTEKMVSEETRVNYLAFEQTTQSESGKYVYYACNKIERGSVATPYGQAPEDLGWSTDTLVPTKTQRYLWKFEYIYYSDGSVEIAGPVNLSIAGQDADATEAINKTKQELLEKLVTVRDESLAAAEEAKQGLTAVNTKVDSAKEELTQTKQQLTTVADDLSQAKTDLQNAISAVDTKATNLKSDLSQAKQDLTSQAQQLQAQANAQSELTKRVSSVEKTANGTKTTVNELSKTVDSNTKNITSVTARTKVVEDDLTSTKTTLSQVKTTADSASQKTATLETGLDGLSAKFENLKIGGTNLLLYSADPWQAPSGYYQSSGAVRTDEMLNGSVVYKTRSIWSRLAMNWGKHLIDRPDVKVGDEFTYSVYVRTDQESPIKARLFFRYSGQSNTEDMTGEKTITQEWQRFTKTFTVTQKMLSDSSKLSWVGFEQTSNSEDGKFVYYACNKLERGNIATDYNPNDADVEQKIAEYKQSADQNYASLQTTVQNLDGTVQHNKTVADQTAQGFSTRIESLETYKDGETTRANQYFESAKTETARQLTVERTAIAKDYVAKSTYTSDVTGIRNELSATTTTANATKTNLANYQASNDKVVASLQSNLQTANGNISNLQTKVEAVPGQITSAVSAVEGKIPTSSGGRNLAQGTSKDWSKPFTGFSGVQNTCPNLYRVTTDGLVVGDTFKTRVVLKYTDIRPASGKTAEIWLQGAGNVTDWKSGAYPSGDGGRRSISGSGQIVFELTDKINADHLRNAYWSCSFRTDWIASGSLQWRLFKAERGMFFTDWQPAPEDAINQISSLSSELKQTKDGITLLATKTELNTAKNELQSGINTATNKANAAQNTANSAQNKANSNAQTISTHTTQISALNTGLQAKVSQTDFNTLSGRVTTAENNITAKANELSSKITSVEGKIPTSVGGTNLLLYSADPWGAPNGYYQNAGAVKTNDKLNGSIVYKTSGVWNSLRSNWGKHLIDRKNVKVGDEFTYSIYAKTDQSSIRTRLFIRFSGQTNAEGLTEDITLTNEWKKLSVTFKVTQKMVANQTKLSWVGFEQTSNSENGKFVYYACNKLERGNIATDYSPAPEDTIEEISSLSSEFKQTTDSIKASVQSLDNNTVKSSSLTINSDGIVMKAGKSTTDVANAIGSYFSVNQNAIDLFADKIKVKGNMIVDGTITGDKIKASSVDVSKIVGIDANFIKSKIEHAMIDWLKGKTITAYNDNMTIDLQNGRISFKDGTNAVYRQTPDGIHTGFLHFESGSQGGVYAAFGATSTRQGINSKSSEFAGIRCYRVSKNGDSHDAKIDKIEVIGDTVQFGHGYRSDGTIGGGFIMDTAAYGNETPYSLNRVVKSIESLWRILHDHAKNTGYRFNDSAFINALNNEYNAWHDMHND